MVASMCKTTEVDASMWPLEAHLVRLSTECGLQIRTRSLGEWVNNLVLMIKQRYRIIRQFSYKTGLQSADGTMEGRRRGRVWRRRSLIGN